jgi:hypothetical protein
MKLVLNGILISCICRRTVEGIGVSGRLITRSIGAACGYVGGGQILIASKGSVFDVQVLPVNMDNTVGCLTYKIYC